MDNKVMEDNQNRIRSYFSIQHILSAGLFCKLGNEIEKNHPGLGNFDEEAYSSHRSYIISSIITSVAFLEATINELFCDADAPEGHWNRLFDEKVKKIMIEVWEKIERFSILDKYEFLLTISNKQPFDRGAEPYQSVKVLIDLRNELVHGRPKSRPLQGEPDPGPLDSEKIGKKLKDRFETNKLMKGSQNPFYPDHCLGHGCAAWGVNKSVEFTDDFFNKLELTCIYDHVRKKVLGDVSI